MDKRELEQWLYGNDPTPPSPSAVATALGLPVDEVADTTLLRTAMSVRALRFTLAVLHDVFATDVDVWVWLAEPREELNGVSAREALLRGRAAVVEELAIRTWNDFARQPMSA